MAEINWWAVLQLPSHRSCSEVPGIRGAVLNAWQREAGDTRVPEPTSARPASSALLSCSRWSRRHASRSSSDRGPALSTALAYGLLAGAGMVAASFGINYQFANRSLTLRLIDGGYHTVQFLLFGLVLGLWH